jgi:hypothetical protein
VSAGFRRIGPLSKSSATESNWCCSHCCWIERKPNCWE